MLLPVVFGPLIRPNIILLENFICEDIIEKICNRWRNDDTKLEIFREMFDDV